MRKGHIKELNGRFQITLDLGTDPATKKRKRHYSTHSSRQEAKDALAYLLDPSGQQTVNDFLDEWLSLTTNNLSSNTVYVYGRYLKMLKDYFPLIDYRKIRRKQAEKIISELLRKYKPGTVAVMRRLLSTAYNRAIAWEETDFNPFKGIRIKAEHVEREVWTPGQVAAFLSAAKERQGNPSYYVAYMIALYTGSIAVKEEIHNDYDKGGKFVSGTKTRASRRNIAMPGELIAVLNTHRERLGEEAEYVIVTNKLTPINQRNLTKAMYEIIRNVGHPPIRFHDFRHTHASILLANGVNVKVIQERLGHSRISTTLDTYSHVFPSQQREAADLLNSIIPSK
ncbi:tyrosine-type recombinase/integrase [Rossellomorea marisflavi]|uniref:tyrosine-type recombinase/integrase n=1 Tax=Rossellomorea marisflavi TaxID=189381 RepID=UPI00131734AA|nr:tyrosine-type recombinase/integrase [Rossellomorea marisflavi]QHA36880.1 tyrosine-type recombinase/integrase [Rossellomorea marisflavi]